MNLGNVWKKTPGVRLPTEVWETFNEKLEEANVPWQVAISSFITAINTGDLKLKKVSEPVKPNYSFRTGITYYEMQGHPIYTKRARSKCWFVCNPRAKHYDPDIFY